MTIGIFKNVRKKPHWKNSVVNDNAESDRWAGLTWSDQRESVTPAWHTTFCLIRQPGGHRKGCFLYCNLVFMCQSSMHRKWHQSTWSIKPNAITIIHTLSDQMILHGKLNICCGRWSTEASLMAVLSFCLFQSHPPLSLLSLFTDVQFICFSASVHNRVT